MFHHHIRILAGCDSAASCPVGCALVFPEFNEICYDHIFEHPELNPQDFESFEQECLSQDALALVQYALELRAGLHYRSGRLELQRRR